jgi:hypothetical protein
MERVMTNKWLYGIGFSMLFLCASQAGAVQVESIITEQVNGTEMIGLSIELTTSDGIKNFVWDGVDSGGLSYALDEVTMDSDLTIDTSNGEWTFTNSTGFTISQMKLDAFSVNTVFDLVFDDDAFSTPNSGNGDFFQETFDTNVTLGAAIFDGPVGVNTAAPLPDLYRYLIFDFSAAPLIADGSFIFTADTDKVLLPVPLPPALLFFASGLFTLLNFTRRKG